MWEWTSDFTASFIGICLVLPSSVRDVRRREICLQLTGIGIAAGIACRIFRTEGPFIGGLASGAASLLPGLFIAVLSILSGGGVGMGDALIIVLIGLWNDGFSAWVILFAAMGMVLTAAGVQRIATGHIYGSRRKQELPFVPFLLAGQILFLIGTLLEL